MSWPLSEWTGGDAAGSSGADEGIRQIVQAVGWFAQIKDLRNGVSESKPGHHLSIAVAVRTRCHSESCENIDVRIFLSGSAVAPK